MTLGRSMCGSDGRAGGAAVSVVMASMLRHVPVRAQTGAPPSVRGLSPRGGRSEAPANDRAKPGHYPPGMAGAKLLPMTGRSPGTIPRNGRSEARALLTGLQERQDGQHTAVVVVAGGQVELAEDVRDV